MVTGNPNETPFRHRHGSRQCDPDLGSHSRHSAGDHEIEEKQKPEELDSLRRREVLLLRMNFGLSALILLATAFARAA